MEVKIEKPEDQQYQFVNTAKNLAELFFANAGLNPDQVAYEQAILPDSNHYVTAAAVPGLAGARSWRPLNYRTMQERVESVAEYLASIGVEKGTRVMIVSNTRPEWVETEMAVYTAGGVVVCGYPSNTAEQLGYLMHDSGARIVVTENQEQADKIFSLLEREIDIPQVEDRPACRVKTEVSHIITFEDIVCARDTECVPPPIAKFSRIAGRPRAIPAEDYLEVAKSMFEASRCYEQINANDPATIIYTSGTTGAPKGVVATHGQSLANIRQIINSGIWEGAGSAFHMLPTAAHAFQRRIDQFTTCTYARGRYPSIADKTSSQLSEPARNSLAQEMKEAGADAIVVVPKILERIKAKVMAGLDEKGFAGKIIKWVINRYAAYSRHEHEGKGHTVEERLVHGIIEKTIGPSVKNLIKSRIAGPNLSRFVSGGAPLSKNIQYFFIGLGMPIYEGYGSTESNCPVTVNTPRNHRVGSVGKVLDQDIELKVAENGELLIRGPNIAREYLNRPKATQETWDEEGWLHTRDLAEIDKDGYLYIHGRIDGIIVPTHGENVQAEHVENAMRVLPYLNDIVLIGQGREYLVALVSIADADKAELLQKHGLPADAGEDKLRDIVWQDIADRVNSELRPFERIGNVAVIPELTVGDGLTPSLKVQRKTVEKKFGYVIDELYKENRRPFAPRK